MFIYKIIVLYIWLCNYYYKPADYITIYKTSTVLTNAMLMINTEVTHTTLLDALTTELVLVSHNHCSDTITIAGIGPISIPIAEIGAAL